MHNLCEAIPPMEYDFKRKQTQPKKSTRYKIDRVLTAI